MPATSGDVIDSLAGIAPGSSFDKVRDQRPEARKNAQASYIALFAPRDPGGVSLQERFAVASFVAGLHGEPQTAEHYAAGLAAAGASPELSAAVAAEIDAATARGPYGVFPKGPLSAEDAPGAEHRVAPDLAARLGKRLVAAFEHTHMLVFHPRDAAAPSLQRMLDAGWTTTDVVTLSQLVSFLSFQIRIVAGLRALAAARA